MLGDGSVSEGVCHQAWRPQGALPTHKPYANKFSITLGISQRAVASLAWEGGPWRQVTFLYWPLESRHTLLNASSEIHECLYYPASVWCSWHGPWRLICLFQLPLSSSSGDGNDLSEVTTDNKTLPCYSTEAEKWMNKAGGGVFALTYCAFWRAWSLFLGRYSEFLIMAWSRTW